MSVGLVVAVCLSALVGPGQQLSGLFCMSVFASVRETTLIG